MNTNVIRFNTGRMYGASGQRIAATKLADGRVFFVDVSRGLDYVTDEPCELTECDIMRAYDSGTCTAPFWSMSGASAELTHDALDALRAAARSI